MKILRTVSLVVMLMALLVASVGAQGGPPGSWTTDMTFLNLEDQEAALEITRFAEFDPASPATDPGTLITSTTVAANGSFYYNPVNDPSFPVGFGGSVVASSDRKMAATITVGNSEAGVAYASDAYAGVLEIAQSVFLPIVMGKLGVWNTMMAIQNAGSQPADITIQYIGTGAPGNTTITDLPANMMALVDQGVNVGMTNFNGSALVTSDQPLAIVVEEYKSTGGVLVDYVGVPSTKAAQTVYMPGYIALGVWATDFTVVNTTGSVANVEITFVGATNVVTGSIAANQSAYVNGTAGYYPTGWTGTAPTGTYYGAAVVTSDRNIVIVYNMANTGPGGAGNLNLGYVAPTAADGALKAAMPLVMNKAYGGGWDSTFSIQVIGGGVAGLSMAYSGVTLPVTETITDNYTFNFSTAGNKGYGDLVAGYAGGVVVTSNKPILIIGDQAGPYVGDSSAGFPGVPLP